MRADVRSLLEMDETVHLEVALGFVHFRTGFAFEGANADVVLAMTKKLRFTDETFGENNNTINTKYGMIRHGFKTLHMKNMLKSSYSAERHSEDF